LYAEEIIRPSADVSDRARQGVGPQDYGRL